MDDVKVPPQLRAFIIAILNRERRQDDEPCIYVSSTQRKWTDVEMEANNPAAVQDNSEMDELQCDMLMFSIKQIMVEDLRRGIKEFMNMRQRRIEQPMFNTLLLSNPSSAEWEREIAEREKAEAAARKEEERKRLFETFLTWSDKSEIGESFYLPAPKWFVGDAAEYDENGLKRVDSLGSLDNDALESRPRKRMKLNGELEQHKVSKA